MRPLSRLIGVATMALSTVAVGGWTGLGFRSDYDGVELVGQLIKPRGGGPFPTVILLHGCGGVFGSAEEALRRHATWLAKHGYAALILDSFGPRDLTGGQMCSLDGLARAREFRPLDVTAAVRHLVQQPYVDSGNLFLMGQSNGGSVALRLAGGGYDYGLDGDFRFRAMVAYYPWCGAVRPRMVTPVLMFVAGRDDWVDPGECHYVAAAERGVPLELVTYERAHHSFDLDIAFQHFEGRAVAGSPKAARDSRRKMVKFFDRHRAD